jgi:nitrite reductase/ring-hydroxylating ferredoxin subunit
MTTENPNPDPRTGLSRRAALRAAATAGAVVAAAAGLAACGEDKESMDTSGGEASSGATPAPKAGTKLASAAEVPPGNGGVFPTGGNQSQPKYVVGQTSQGQFVGYDAKCPHQGCNVSQIRNGMIVCPCHNSQFKLEDGSVTKGPATTGLTKINVRKQGEDIVLA